MKHRKSVLSALTRSCTAVCGVFVALMVTLGDGSEFYSSWAAARFSDLPAQSAPLLDPDMDGEANLVEFAFGTDPRAADGLAGALTPSQVTVYETNSVMSVDVLEREGRRPGVQIDLYLSADITNWFRPWWLRVVTNLQPGDPAGAERESLSTVLPGTNRWFVRSNVRLIEAGPEAARYYVATNGSDSNPGTNIAQPFATLAKAASLANAGNLIYLRGGTYNWTSTVSLSRSGSATAPIRVRAYPGEKPVLDFSGQAFASTNRGISLSGHWWHLYGLEIVGAGDNGISITGKSNVIERCVFRQCRDSGLQISSGGAYNLILNCDSYRNFDPGTFGENADGFAAKDSPPSSFIGRGNVFMGCRAWENSDDGWDLWQATNTVVISNCWAWRNGIDFWGLGTNFAGDGNGFKLGGNYYPGPHRVDRCVSFYNAQAGFDQNNNLAGQTLDHCSALNNGGRNFNLDHGTNVTPHVVRNCLSIGGTGDRFRSGSLLTNNSWQVLSPPANTNDILSAEVSWALAPRRADGGLPEAPLLRPVPGGRLVDQGINLGKPFSGAAPDLGAFETPEW